MMELHDYVSDEHKRRRKGGEPETVRDCGETSAAREDNLDRSVAVPVGNTHQKVPSGTGNDIV